MAPLRGEIFRPRVLPDEAAATVARLMATIAALEGRVAMLEAELGAARKLLAVHESAHARSSVSITQKAMNRSKRKKRAKKGGRTKAEKGGSRRGRRGASHRRRAESVVEHTADACACGSADIRDVGTRSKLVIEIP